MTNQVADHTRQEITRSRGVVFEISDVVFFDPGLGARLIAEAEAAKHQVPSLDSPHQHELCSQMRSFINREAE
jgi:hypothetical protein